MNVAPDIVGLVAGAIVTGSSLPKIFSRFSELVSGDAAFNLSDLWRDGLLGVGNGLWAYVGLTSGLVSMTACCGLNALFLTILVFLNLRSGPRRRRVPNTRSNA